LSGDLLTQITKPRSTKFYTKNYEGQGTSQDQASAYHVRNLSDNVELGSFRSPSMTRARGLYNSTTHTSTGTAILATEDRIRRFSQEKLASDGFDQFVECIPQYPSHRPSHPILTMSFPSTTPPPSPKTKSFQCTPPP
jgi:hypothetical protein